VSGFAMRRQLGKTGLQVSPLGLGGGNGISSEDVLYAFDQGINYFFFSSDLHHMAYQRSAEAIRKLCGRGSSVRDEVVLATVSYLNDPDKLLTVLLDQFSELKIDYIDVFHWGWVTDKVDALALYQAAAAFKSGETASQEQSLFRASVMMAHAQEINKELVQRGLVRHVGMSFHSRKMARVMMQDIDVLMIRYNIARPDVEEHVFAHLTGKKDSDPGIVAFNVAREGILSFHRPPRGYPAQLPVPTIPECYRFALTNPSVDLVLAGITTRQELLQALAALEQGPLSPDENEFIREYGSLYRGDMLKTFYPFVSTPLARSLSKN